MLAPPKPPVVPEALIPEARDRQRRRQALLAASIAVAAGLVLGIHALVGGSSSSVAGQTTPAPGAVPRCQSTQLAARLYFQASTQMEIGSARITNMGANACAIPRAWPAFRVTAMGRDFALTQHHYPGSFLRGSAGILAPHHAVGIDMMWSNWCGTPHMPASRGGEPLDVLTITFAIRLGPGVVVTAAHRGTPQCLAPGHPSGLFFYPAELG